MASKKITTAVVCGKLCTAPPGDYFVTCSFDENHVLLRSRLPYHIIKCVKRHPGHNKIQCPYDAAEYIDRDEFQEHILTCESKRSASSAKYETAELRASGNMCNIKQTPFFHACAPEPDEDWGAIPPSDSPPDLLLEKEEFVPERIGGVGRGLSLKKSLPKKGIGRAEALRRIYEAYEQKKRLDASCFSSASEKDNSLSDSINGQFDED